MPRHDLICPTCSHILEDVRLSATACMIHLPCSSVMEILWTAPSRAHTVHPRERAVVWYDPRTGRHATPGRNDVPMPERYARQGYERREFASLHDLDTFCKSNNLVNQRAHYDNSGRSYDDE